MSDEVFLAAFLDSDEQVSLKVLSVTLGNPVFSAKDVQPLCELRYPRLRAIAEGIDILIISEPTPASTVSNLSAAPFTCSSTDILFTVTLRYAIGMDVESAVVLLVPRSTILHQVSCVSSSPQKYVGWESWGETGSRMLDIQPSDVWVCHSYGMKFVHSRDGEAFACLYDLNPYATRKVVNTANSPDLPWKPMEKETKISGRRNPFSTDVFTSLPGREASLDLIPNEHGWEATMITGDHVVMVQVSGSTTNTLSPSIIRRSVEPSAWEICLHGNVTRQYQTAFSLMVEALKGRGPNYRTNVACIATL